MMLMKKIDARGLRCPLPVLRLRKELRLIDLGEEMEILVNDPAAPDDIKTFCEESGHTILAKIKNGDDYYLVIRRGRI